VLIIVRVYLIACSAPFKSAVKNVVKKEKIVGGLLAGSKAKKKGADISGNRKLTFACQLDSIPIKFQK
jgi:hypothetical protein